MVLPASASLVILPDVVITEVGQRGNLSGVRTYFETFGAFTAADLPTGFFEGDEIVVSIRATEGMRFQLEGGSEFTFSLHYGASVYPDLGRIGTPLSSYQVEFGNLVGDNAPDLAIPNGLTVTNTFLAGPGGLTFGTYSPQIITDTLTFDSITISGIADASMDARWEDDAAYAFSSVPVSLGLYTEGGTLSLIPVPEPSSAILLGLGALGIATRRQRPF